MINFILVCKNIMKGKKLIGEIDSFKNKQDIGLFTFYIATSNPNSTISFSKQIQEPKVKKSDNTKLFEHHKKQTRIIGQYRGNDRPQRRLKTLQACMNSSCQNQEGKQVTHQQKFSTLIPSQFDQVKDMLNFKRQTNKKLLQQLLMKNEVDNQILYRFSSKKGLINPQKIFRTKKCSLNALPKHASPFKSGYLSKITKKMCKSQEKQQKIMKNSSEEMISQKPKLSLHEIKAFNEQLDIQFKLQEQKFRPNMFPFNKKRYSSHLKDSRSSDKHPFSNDNLIQKLKNSNKLIQIKEKSLQKIPFDTSKTFLPYRENLLVTACQQKSKKDNQTLNRLSNLQLYKSSKVKFLKNQTEYQNHLRERFSCFRKQKMKIYEQRGKNHSEIQKRNEYESLKKFQNLNQKEKIRSNNNLSNSSMHEGIKNLKNKKIIPKEEYDFKNKRKQFKKSLLLIVRKVEDSNVSL